MHVIRACACVCMLCIALVTQLQGLPLLPHATQGLPFALVCVHKSVSEILASCTHHLKCACGVSSWHADCLVGVLSNLDDADDNAYHLLPKSTSGQQQISRVKDRRDDRHQQRGKSCQTCMHDGMHHPSQVLQRSGAGSNAACRCVVRQDMWTT